MDVLPELETAAHRCPYLPDLSAHSRFVHPLCRMSSALYGQLLAQGYRRSGSQVYMPCCRSCQLCIPVRVAVPEFSPKRRQRRCCKANENLEVFLKSADFDPEHFLLYRAYQQARHADSGMAQANPKDYLAFLSSDWSDTVFAEFRLKGELLAVAVIDQVECALSSVYTFYAPNHDSLSLGRYAVLWTIDWAQRLGLSWLYLGYWIPTCRKMAYKTEYQPMQFFYRNQWHWQAPVMQEYA